MACRRESQKYMTINGESTHTRYAIGQKRCGTCELFLTWDLDNYCPCCGHRLRLRPKNSRLRKQFNNILKQKVQDQKVERSNDLLTFLLYFWV
ncbi:hypothetical protein [Candidatus Nitrosocosmicus sp. R]